MKKMLVCAFALTLTPWFSASAQQNELYMDRILKLGDAYCPKSVSPIPCSTEFMKMATLAAHIDLAMATSKAYAAIGDQKAVEELLPELKKNSSELEVMVKGFDQKFPLKQ